MSSGGKGRAQKFVRSVILCLGCAEFLNGKIYQINIKRSIYMLINVGLLYGIYRLYFSHPILSIIVFELELIVSAEVQKKRNHIQKAQKQAPRNTQYSSP